MTRIKVAWICSFSNSKVRERLPLRQGWTSSILWRLTGRKSTQGIDTAIWNTNAIEEFEKIKDVEVHVICPVRNLLKKIIEYKDSGIYYHFFREQNSSMVCFAFHQLFTKYTSRYHRNRRIITQLIYKISPDVVHMMGAENPYYSLSLLDVPKRIPTILQLQALLCRLVDVTQVPEERKSFYHKGEIEKELIRRADYIGTKNKIFREYILNYIKSDAFFVETSLHMAQKIDVCKCEKEFDFVYFSSDISKAGREALESFILAHQIQPQITLDIVGGYDAGFRAQLDEIVRQSGVEGAVIFEGRLPSHDDVIRQIRKARFALLPLKMDFVPNTVHEAMANGLPVVTTVTNGTPSLNKNRESVLISNQGDYKSMAENMLRLLDDTCFAETIMHNAVITEMENGTNSDIARQWYKAYKSCAKTK